jgi:hypothetical protein
MMYLKIVWREGKEIDTGKIADGRMEKTPLTMRVMMPDGSSCRFSGQPSGDSIKGGYSCQGPPRGEQGTWEARWKKRGQEKPPE